MSLRFHLDTLREAPGRLQAVADWARDETRKINADTGLTAEGRERLVREMREKTRAKVATIRSEAAEAKLPVVSIGGAKRIRRDDALTYLAEREPLVPENAGARGLTATQEVAS